MIDFADFPAEARRGEHHGSTTKRSVEDAVVRQTIRTSRSDWPDLLAIVETRLVAVRVGRNGDALRALVAYAERAECLLASSRRFGAHTCAFALRCQAEHGILPTS